MSAREDEPRAVRQTIAAASREKALTFVDHAFLFDNSSADEPYRFVAELRGGRIARRGTINPRWWISLGL